MLNLLKLLCLPPCFPRNVIEHVAFQPPPPTYTVEPIGEDTPYYKCHINFIRSLYFRVPPLQFRSIKCSYATTVVSTKICCMYYGVTNPTTKTTILYSHGNASDLGTTIGLCVWLARSLHCNILTYDYSGYGRSTGKPSERKMYADIEAAFDLLLKEFNCSPGDVILMGQSLGSAPTVHLASKVLVKGVIIQSGFASALNIVFTHEQPKSMCCDAFQNMNKVGDVKSPLLVIHGTEDEAIDIRHGIALYERCSNTVEPLWVNGGQHNDLEYYKEFMDRLKVFINMELSHRSVKLEE